MSRDAKKDPSRASRRIECLRLGKKDLMPDIYTDEHAVDEKSLDVMSVDDKGIEIDLSLGFDPYDTGAFYKK